MRQRRLPFATEYVAKVKSDADGKMVQVKFGGPPKKLTRGLRRHLRKVHRQKPAEAISQLSRLGLDISALGLDR